MLKRNPECSNSPFSEAWQTHFVTNVMLVVFRIYPHSQNLVIPLLLASDCRKMHTINRLFLH